MITRRQALKAGALGALGCMANGALLNAAGQAPVATTGTATGGPFAVPPLPYPFDALQPYIDARTMEIHHDKHHAAYVANLNKAAAEYPELAKMSPESMLRDLQAIPEKVRTTVRNNGGGHYNHSLFWQMLKKDGGAPTGNLAKAIDGAFGNFASFKESFSKAAMGQFGSGWAWLVLGLDKRLSIEPSANQDSPISQGKQPLLGIDVWEHAYYLNYQNRRADYVAALFHVIHWDYVSERYEKALG